MAGYFLVQKKDGNLIFKDYGGWEFRNNSTMWLINEADKIYKWKDFKEIHICTADSERNKEDYSFSKENSYYNLIPDFNFHGWPQVGIDDYEIEIKKIDDAGKEKAEINKVGWIGSLKTNIRRKIAYEIGKKNNDKMDIMDMNWIYTNDIKLKHTRYMSLVDLVKKYSVLIDIEGYGFSARLKYFLWSHRPVILVERPHKEYFFKYLKEWEHYIPVKRDLTDLLEKVDWCLNNYERACEIAERAYNFSKEYLTREACYKEWDNIIKKEIEKRNIEENTKETKE